MPTNRSVERATAICSLRGIVAKSTSRSSICRCCCFMIFRISSSFVILRPICFPGLKARLEYVTRMGSVRERSCAPLSSESVSLSLRACMHDSENDTWLHEKTKKLSKNVLRECHEQFTPAEVTGPIQIFPYEICSTGERNNHLLRTYDMIYCMLPDMPNGMNTCVGVYKQRGNNSGSHQHA